MTNKIHIYGKENNIHILGKDVFSLQILPNGKVVEAASTTPAECVELFNNGGVWDLFYRCVWSIPKEDCNGRGILPGEGCTYEFYVSHGACHVVCRRD